MISQLFPNFSPTQISQRDLIIKMLQYEDNLYLSEYGQNLLRDRGNQTSSLLGAKTIQMLTLDNFGFNTNEDSLKNYRKIFSFYYKTPWDYDANVLNSVFYMRENKCVYYTTKKLYVGDMLPNLSVYNLDGKTKRNLVEILNNDFDYAIVAAFSLS
jgi:hypothetical protein